jgi:hypothetical protein
MKNKNLVIKFKGDFDIQCEEDNAFFIDSDGDKNYLDEFMRVDPAGDFKSFDGVRGTSYFTFDLVKLVDNGDGVKFFYGYTRG